MQQANQITTEGRDHASQILELERRLRSQVHRAGFDVAVAREIARLKAKNQARRYTTAKLRHKAYLRAQLEAQRQAHAVQLEAQRQAHAVQLEEMQQAHADQLEEQAEQFQDRENALVARMTDTYEFLLQAFEKKLRFTEAKLQLQATGDIV